MRHSRGVADTLTAQTRLSAWPTPAASTGEGGPHGLDGGAGARAMLRGTELESWPTPTSTNPNDGQAPDEYESRRRRRLQEKHRNGNGAGMVLAQAVLSRSARPTATAGDAIGAGNRNLEGSKAHAGTSLTDAVNGGQRPRSSPSWASPNAGDDRGPSPGLEAAQARHAARGVHKQVSLRDQVPRAAGSASPMGLPTRQDGANNGGPSQVEERNSLSLNAQARGALNPLWVSTLMGWPTHWCCLHPMTEESCEECERGGWTQVGAAEHTGDEVRVLRDDGGPPDAAPQGPGPDEQLPGQHRDLLPALPRPGALRGRGLATGGAGVLQGLRSDLQAEAVEAGEALREPGVPGGLRSTGGGEALARRWPATVGLWPAPPGPQHAWEPPRLTPSYPGRTARLRMLGNGQVPATAVLAWRVLGGGM